MVFGFAFLVALGLGAPIEAWLSGAAISAFGNADFIIGVAIGGTLAGALMCIGYTIWWAVYWLRRS